MPKSPSLLNVRYELHYRRIKSNEELISGIHTVNNLEVKARNNLHGTIPKEEVEKAFYDLHSYFASRRNVVSGTENDDTFPDEREPIEDSDCCQTTAGDGIDNMFTLIDDNNAPGGRILNINFPNLLAPETIPEDNISVRFKIYANGALYNDLPLSTLSDCQAFPANGNTFLLDQVTGDSFADCPQEVVLAVIFYTEIVEEFSSPRTVVCGYERFTFTPPNSPC